MKWGNIGGGLLGGGVLGGLLGFNTQQQQDAQSQAANLQSNAALAGINAQQSNFAAIQKLLEPFVTTGTNALTQQGNLAGVNGSDAQQAAIDAIQKSPYFTSQQKLGQEAILANGSATGGLRGGNVQGALAQFAPSQLAQAIQQQYSNLGGLTSLGQNAAAMTGNAGTTTANGVSNLLQQQGAAQAGGVIANAKTEAGFLNSPFQILGGLAGFTGGKLF